MTLRAPLADEVVSKALTGSVHHSFLSLERSWDYGARDLIRALASEVLRLRQANGELQHTAEVKR
jgi:hypothetical protein